MSDIVVYNNGELELNVSVQQDTIWWSGNLNPDTEIKQF